METELLESIPLFAALTSDQRNELAASLQTHQFTANQPIFWIGESGSEFFIIRKGRVNILIPDQSGREITLAVLTEGNFFAELALLDGLPRSATARADTDVTLLSLSREEFHTFIKKHPSAAIHIMAVLGRRQRDVVDKLRGIKNANEVYDEQETQWHRTADTIAAFASSPLFFIANIAIFAGWIIYNVKAGPAAWDPYPFSLMSMVVSTEALTLSIFILISQTRASVVDRIRADLDYQVSLKAHIEIMQLHTKLDRIEDSVKQREKSD